jgi:hypothetical protein
MKFAANQAGNNKNTILAAIILAVITLFGGSVKAASAATASFVGLDTTTRGSWQAKYGAEGYVIPNLTQSIPGYATFAPQNALLYTWNAGTSDARAVKMPNSGSGIASTFYNNPGFSLDINAVDSNTHQIAVYVLDWDGFGSRSQTLQVVDASSNAVLDTEQVANFANGTYVIWNVTGHVRININRTGGSNAVVAGVFFGKNATAAAAPASATATFTGADTSTQGNWQGKYGVDGYSISNSTQNLPAYASFGVQNQMNYTWNAATSDARALQIPNSTMHMASTWYNSPSFNFDVNLTDSNSHRVALYAIDWDGSGRRAQTVQVIDAASSKVLDTETISGFSSGMYLVWNVTGHVKINVTMTGTSNAVVSGIFFDSNSGNNNASAPAAPKTTAASNGVLSASTSALSFGSVQLSSSSVQNVTLTNTGNANVTISNVSVSGAGFAAAGLPTGTVLTPGQSATMQATLTPAMAGKVTGAITVSSNATNGSNAIALSGTGIAQTTHSVNLNWVPSTSQVAGYNVYVSTTEGGAYAKLTSTPVNSTSFVDSGLQTAQTRYYVVTSVDSSNNESAFSSPVSAIVP